ncbi:hypothetical protein DPMN_131234 [Dreissena polymorpha]|uniref:Uncharacterized protein n=2 Tax=Dreissena polymorpha TaxID=45954 RepID=A0A9D4H672_DREPO|nr:hypothetical protein DPMN_131234 [Dreissena polymorpha]
MESFGDKAFKLILLLAINLTVTNSQIDVTPCTDQTNCTTLSNSVCSLVSGFCTCSSAQKRVPNAARDGCDYTCGSLTNPTNGAVSTTGIITASVATYTCSSGFQLNAANTRTCVESTGWSGTQPNCTAGKINDDCSSKTDLCANIANGECSGGICNCKTGYQDDGTNLNCIDINECASVPCQNGATCVNGLAQYTCQCVAGWNGPNCQTDIDECATLPCKNGATCTHGLATYQCTCAPGYSGVNCDTDINECSSNPCVNGGTCVDFVNGYNCVCVAGYSGAQCQTDIDECSTVSCANGATCENLINAYKCKCVTGFTGNLCQTNINDCQGVVCNNGGTCVDQANEYECNCVSGYNGTHCDTNINDCASITCANSGTCIDKINSFSCACAPGWTGTLCQTGVDECNSNACTNNATCSDVHNGYTCQCQDGFTGAFCQTEINECDSNPCLNGGACANLVNKYTCTCIAGFTGSNCGTNIDNCSPDPCTRGTCIDEVNDFSCTCPLGYEGKTCSDNINECSSLPCQNNGTCNDLVNSFSCNCAPGFTGTTCAADINECLTKQCQNGATCVDLVNAYVCQCVAGYTGTNCETDINECSPNPCQNGATCAHSINNYTCTCVAGYTGRNCQIDIDECSPSPCLNGGLCSNEINKYTCNCTSGYTGVNCRPAVLGDDCSVRPAVCSNILNSQCTGGTCQCLAGYEKTGEATCSKKDCKSLGLVDNGIVEYSGGTLYQAVATFTCNTGYTRNGPSSVTCQSDAAWSGAKPTCTINYCPDLTAPINGAVQFIPSKDYLSKAEYSCSVGYTLTGISTRTCTATGAWDGSSPTCVIKDCKAITAPSSGTIDQGTGTTYGSSSYFTCNTGYTLIGALSTTCTSAGNWDNPKPVCEIKDCGTLSEPMNGDVDLSQGTKYGAKASFTCKTGHTLVGLPSPTCTSAGIWSSAAPVCQINDCGLPLNPTNGNVTAPSGTTYQEDASYTCNPGFVINGLPQRTCQADKTWSNAAPTCDRISCGLLFGIQHGSLDISAGVLFEAVARYTCDAGYTLSSGDAVRTCQASGAWSGTLPVCTINNCGNLTAIANGHVLTVEGTTAGAVAQYVCNQGYQIMGFANRTCGNDGNWIGVPPSCKILDCGNVPTVQFGTLSYSPNTEYGSSVIYSCDSASGYGLDGVTSRVCEATGKWSATQPSCKLLDCGAPKPLQNGRYTHGNTVVNHTVTYSCNTGYGLVGDPTVECQTTGYWGTLPTCSLDCANAPTVSHATVVVPSGTLVGAHATYTCNSGYVLSGSAAIQCQIDGEWSKLPICYIVTIAYNQPCMSTSQCSTDQSTCRSDSGQNKCLCAASGEMYDVQTDTCLKVCGALPDIMYGTVVNPTIPSAGQIAVYSCNAGYALDGTSIRTCQSNGQWSSSEPECTFGCPYPESPLNGYANVSDGIVAGNRLQYWCMTGYTLVGEEFRICEDDSTWSGVEPKCAIECEELPPIENGYIDKSAGSWEGATVIYVCNNDYALVGDSTRSCEYTGKWSGLAPTCLFAIFPDIVLVLGSMFLFIVLVDIFVLVFFLYYKYHKKKEEIKFEDLEKKEDEEKDDEDEKSFDDTMVKPPGFSIYSKKPNAPQAFDEDEAPHPPPKPAIKSKILSMSTLRKSGSALRSVFNRVRKYKPEVEEPSKDDRSFTGKQAGFVSPALGNLSGDRFRGTPGLFRADEARDNGYQTEYSDEHNVSFDSSIEDLNA